MDGLIFSDGVFNRAGNKLLDLLRGRTGHEQEATATLTWNVQDLFVVAWNGSQYQPQTRTPARRNPGNLRVLDEVS